MNDQQLQECKDRLAEAENYGATGVVLSPPELRRLLDCIDVYDRLQRIRCGE